MAAPDPERLAVWRSFVIAHSLLDRALNQALLDERDIPLAWFEVLNALQLAGGRVRVMDLAAVELCQKSKLPIMVFNYKREGNLERAIAGQPIGTFVCE